MITIAQVIYYITALNISMTEVDYRAKESQGYILVGVFKDHLTATDITVTVTPLTVEQAQIQNRLPNETRVPYTTINLFSPNKAGKQDFEFNYPQYMQQIAATYM